MSENRLATKAKLFGPCPKVVWEPNDKGSHGMFDDGIEEKTATPDAKPSRHGPYLQKLAEENGIELEPERGKDCIECGKEHFSGHHRCPLCNALHAAEQRKAGNEKKREEYVNELRMPKPNPIVWDLDFRKAKKNGSQKN